MWRSERVRRASAKRRLALAWELWKWKPHAAQRRWFESGAQVRAAACGRRWGKTESLAVDLATLAVDEALSGRDCRQLVVAPTDNQARLIGAETVAKLLDAADQERLAGFVLDVRQRPALQVTLCREGTDPRVSNDKKAKDAGPAVSRIVFRSAGRDGRGLRGLWAHRIAADEAGYIPDRVLTEVVLPMLTDVGGEFILASSPAGRRNVFYRLFARGQASGGRPDEYGLTYASYQCPSTDNPHLDHAFLAAMAEELGETQFRQEYGAEFVDDFGCVFRADDIDAALVADDRVRTVDGNLVSDPQPDCHYVIGIDWGRKLDFTVLTVLEAGRKPARVVGLWRWQGTSWEAQVGEIAGIVARFDPQRVLLDGSGIGDPLAETLRQAVRGRVGDEGRVPSIERFQFTADSKQSLVDRLTLGLSSRAITYPAHTALVSELRGFEYGRVGPSGRATTGARAGGHDDCVMSLALAWWVCPVAAPKAPSDLLLLGSSVGLATRE